MLVYELILYIGRHFFYVIGNCVLLHKKHCVQRYADIVRKRINAITKAVLYYELGCESVRSTLFYWVLWYEIIKECFWCNSWRICYFVCYTNRNLWSGRENRLILKNQGIGRVIGSGYTDWMREMLGKVGALAENSPIRLAKVAFKATFFWLNMIRYLWYGGWVGIIEFLRIRTKARYNNGRESGIW